LIYKTLTGEQINDVIRYWRNKLALRDWEISWTMHNDSDMNDCYAQVGHSLPYMTAHIRISDPSTWSANADDTDMEESILHEMVHVRTAEICDKLKGTLTREEELVFLERPTDVLARTLVELRRMSDLFDWEELPEEKKKKKKKKS